jgi:hypothetical protein
MNRKRTVMAAMIALTFSAYAAQIGSQAPDFHGSDSNGKTESLDQYRGKFVVLEWHNHDCPYTVKHYESGNMQSLQKQWTAKGVVWLTVISSAPGQQGYVDAGQENAYMNRRQPSSIPKAISVTCTTPRPPPTCTSSILAGS